MALDPSAFITKMSAVECEHHASSGGVLVKGPGPRIQTRVPPHPPGRSPAPSPATGPDDLRTTDAAGLSTRSLGNLVDPAEIHAVQTCIGYAP